MYISKYLINKSIKKYNVDYQKEKYYITYSDINDGNVLHCNIDIPKHKIYKKGIDLTDKKIFINTSFALGDTVHLISVLKALKHTYKNIYIGVEYNQVNKILSNTFYVDELLDKPVAIDVIDKFDYIVDITAHVGTVGFDNRFVPDYLASLFGITLLDKKPEISLSNDPEVIININKIKRYISLGKPLLGIHFQSSSIHRQIPPHVLDVILNYAKDRYTIVSAYTDDAKTLADEYFKRYPFIIDVSSYVKDVEHLINYVGILDILISAETSVAHIGVALDKPTLVVMGASAFSDVYDYKTPFIKGVNAKYVGTKCSSPCRIHALNTPCPEAKYNIDLKLQEDEYSPCFKYIDKIELLETFKSLEFLIKQRPSISFLPSYYEYEFDYYYKSNMVGKYIGRPYEYFYKYRHNIFYFVREFAYKNKTVAIKGYDKELYKQMLESAFEEGIIFDDCADNIIITDGFYENIDFESLKGKKALILFANKNRLYNFVKKGVDIFDQGVVKKPLNEYTKKELEDILSEYFSDFKIYETPTSYKEYELIYGLSNSQEAQMTHNTFMKSSIHSLQGAFLVCVINDDIELKHYLDVFSIMHYEYITSNKYKELSFFTKTSNDGLDIVELKKGKSLKVFLAFEKENLYNFYTTLKDFDIGIYTAYIPKQEFQSRKDDILQTISNIGIDIVFTDFKNLKDKTYLNCIANKIVFIDRESTLEDLKIYFKDDFETEFNKTIGKFSTSKSVFFSVDNRVVEFLRNIGFEANMFYGYYTNNYYEPSFNEESSKVFLSDVSINKTYADSRITEFFIKRLSNFRTSLKAIDEDILLEDIREVFYDYIYMGAYAIKHNDNSIKHLGIMDFEDEMVFRVALSTINKTRDFPDKVIYPYQLRGIFNGKNIILGLSDIISVSLNKRFFEAFYNKTLFITDYKPILEDLFGKYGEYVSGFSIEDIVEKANYFLDNKQEKKELINYIRKAIREFNLKNLLKKVL